MKIKYLTFHGPIKESSARNLMALCSDAIQDSYNEIYIAFSSLGGAVHSGITLFNFLKALPVKLTFHNIAVIDSIANIIFLAGHSRFACKTSRFLIHGPSNSFAKEQPFNVWQLYELAESLKNDQEKMSDIISQHTSISATDLSKWFIKGETITPERASDLGIITEIKDFTIPTGATVITVNT
jgi:ATP-dependent Clp protease protease subunit